MMGCKMTTGAHLNIAKYRTLLVLISNSTQLKVYETDYCFPLNQTFCLSGINNDDAFDLKV